MANVARLRPTSVLCRSCIQLLAAHAGPSTCRRAGFHTTPPVQATRHKTHQKNTSAARRLGGGFTPYEHKLARIPIPAPGRRKPYPRMEVRRPPFVPPGLREPDRAIRVGDRGRTHPLPSRHKSGPDRVPMDGHMKNFYSRRHSGHPAKDPVTGDLRNELYKQQIKPHEAQSQSSGRFSERARPADSRREEDEDPDSFLHAKDEPPVALAPRPFAKFSPPLLPGLVKSVGELLGKDTLPTPIQMLSLQHFFANNGRTAHIRTSGSSETLLAAETGSGKTLAYLLPMIQGLKESEDAQGPPKFNSPRAIILAPTHELCRQLAASVKQMTHVEKMRTLCFSNPLPKRTKKPDYTKVTVEEFEKESKLRPADIVVGTPSKMLEMFRLTDAVEEQPDGDGGVVVKKDFGESKGLERVQWVIVDEADVLFGHDFRPAVRALLHFVREARLRATTPAEFVDSPEPAPPTDPASNGSARGPVVAVPAVDPATAFTRPPFDLVLSTATVSSSLSLQLMQYHPKMRQLLSPNLHRLPSSLRTEHVAWSGGNRNADIAQKILELWTAEAREKRAQGSRLLHPDKGKVLVFCNTTARAEQLATELAQRAILVTVLTSESEARRRGSNHHLDGFLLDPKSKAQSGKAKGKDKGSDRAKQPQHVPHVQVGVNMHMDAPSPPASVLVTTSLLSRGLDFTPQVRYVLIVDEPKNMVDFVHRAGRSGRAGNEGKVIMFGKEDGRGNYLEEMKHRVRAVA